MTAPQSFSLPGGQRPAPVRAKNTGKEGESFSEAEAAKGAWRGRGNGRELGRRTEPGETPWRW